MERNEWISRIMLSSVPLRQLNHMRQPVGFASGCLIDYSGKRLILTVAHATDNDKNWGIEIKAHEIQTTEVYLIGAMMFLTRGNLINESVDQIDFSYAKVPDDLQPNHHELDETGKIVNQQPKAILEIDFNIRPNSEKLYGFFGGTNFSTEGGLLISDSRLVLDLKFLDAKGDYYRFKLPKKHPGHDYFRGTSGAPILDSQGNVVALVCGGSETDDVIYGIALHPYKAALDVEVMTTNFQT